MAVDVSGPALLAVTQGIGAFYQFLPKLSDIRKADVANDPEIAADVRLGEVAAVTLTLGIGVISSSLTGSPLPVATSAFVCLVLVILYESTLKAHRPFESKRLRIVPDMEAGNA